MAKLPERERVERWRKRIVSADKVYGKWKDRFKVDRLENYAEGYQWSGLGDADAEKKYTINLFFAEIETTRPSLLFSKPKVKIAAKPGREQSFGSTAGAQAQLCEDTVQTFIDDPDVGFGAQTGLGLLDAFARFGVVEVGYTANWIDNPNAGKPVLKEVEGVDGEGEPLQDEDGNAVLQPDQVLAEGSRELLYVKWIPALTFRCSLSDKNAVGANDWVGYYEWHPVEDVKRNKQYKNTKDLKSSGVVADDLRTAEDGNDEREQHHGMVKVWKVWDIRDRVKHVIAEGHQKFLVEGEPYAFLPFAVLKFHERVKDGGHFYPLPATWNWLSPQDEKNEIREQQKVHRRRFERRYTYSKGAIGSDELKKLEDGGDGVYVEDLLPPTSGASPLKPVQDAPLDASNWNALAASDQDFTQVAGSPGESRGVAQTQTATQATLMSAREQLRETSNRAKVSAWLSEIARLMLLAVREHMSLDFWIKRNVDLGAQSAAEDVLKVAVLWKQINAEELGDIDLDITVDLASLSPVTEEAQRGQWSQVLALVANPGVAAILGASDVLLRKTLTYYGIRSETEVREIQKACQAVAMALAQQAGAGGGGGAPGVTAMAGAPGPGGMGGGGMMPQLPTGIGGEMAA